ncbi:MAG: hypothetical protein RL291_2038 [Pseudomonadota bacterium]|jgi:hypothetical protein
MPLIRQISLDDIIARGIVRDSDVVALRRKHQDDGRVAAEEIEKYLAIDASCPVQEAGWPPFLIEIVSDFVVNQMSPAGYLTIENAEWLLERITKGGRIGSKTNLELLINVIDQARWAPEALSVFALEQVALAIQDGLGPVRDRATSAAPGAVSPSDVEILRRMLYAAGGDAANAISRAEAEVLVVINDITAKADNAPDWSDLFVKALTNHVLAGSGYAVPSREEALARDQWIGGNGGQEHAQQSLLAGYRKDDLEAELQKLERVRASIVTNAEVTGPDVSWLIERLGAVATLTPNERKLIDVLAQGNISIVPELSAAIDVRKRAA